MLSWLFDGKRLLEVIIVIGVFVLLFALIWAKHARPILVTILAVAWLGLGTYSGLTCLAYYNSQSEVVGTPEIHDPYEDFNFEEYDIGNIVWYQDENGAYSYSVTYKTATDFEGDNQYTLLVNDSPCKETTATNGRLRGVFEKRFNDIDNERMASIEFDINFAFYSSETTIRIYTNADDTNIGLVREYVQVEGFNLRIIKSVYQS